MYQQTPDDIGKMMAAVIASIGPDVAHSIRPHLEWVIEEIFTTFYLEELTDAELGVLAAAVIPIHSRFLIRQRRDPGPRGRPLRSV